MNNDDFSNIFSSNFKSSKGYNKDKDYTKFSIIRSLKNKENKVEEATVETQAKRYVESTELKTFLEGKGVFKFLVESIKDKTLFTQTKILEQCDFLIDFITTWTNSIPVRKNLKLSKYDFLKNVEDYCIKSEMDDILTDKL